jgi:hypothetical protein
MSEAEIIEKSGADAVRKLRLIKLQSGSPFMINSRELPAGQCYLEYPDGKIELVSLAANSIDFSVVRELTNEESMLIRLKYQLESFHAELYIITGSNGAGKSSVGPGYFPKHIQKKYTVFDGDKLFMQKQREIWNQGIRANKEAKRLAFSFVEETFDRLTEDGYFFSQGAE